MEPLAPFNGTSEEMAALGKFFRQEGLYTFVRWNTFFTNPPLCITEEELREAFAIIDRGLEITDRAVLEISEFRFQISDVNLKSLSKSASRRSRGRPWSRGTPRSR